MWRLFRPNIGSCTMRSHSGMWPRLLNRSNSIWNSVKRGLSRCLPMLKRWLLTILFGLFVPAAILAISKRTVVARINKTIFAKRAADSLLKKQPLAAVSETDRAVSLAAHKLPEAAAHLLKQQYRPDVLAGPVKSRR